MGLTTALQRFAFHRPTVFPVVGRGGSEPWRRLLDHGPVVASPAPRDADILVLAGEIPAAWSPALWALFETLALPRLALWLKPTWLCRPPDLPLGASLEVEQLPDTDWERIRRRLLNPQSPANRPLLPDLPPYPWRGRGDHGQGGEGMMGGKPYGRPMAMTANDPDGLALDDVPTWLGPHFPGLPPGLMLLLHMQGDRVRSVASVDNAFPPTAGFDTGAQPALAALGGRGVKVADLEAVRLTSHLAWLGDFLILAGLPDLAARCRRARHSRRRDRLEPVLDSIDGFLLRRLLRGLGTVSWEQAERLDLSGPVARASELARDARMDDPAYQSLGFEPLTETPGDTLARLRLRLRECRQSLDLMARAGEARCRCPESPRGTLRRRDGRLLTPSRANLALLPELLPGLEWQQMLLVIASLDLDMEAASWR